MAKNKVSEWEDDYPESSPEKFRKGPKSEDNSCYENTSSEEENFGDHNSDSDENK